MRDWPDQRLTRLFGIAHPILQSPMLGTSTLELAVAVSEAGGLGALACGGKGPEDVEALVGAFRAKSGAPVQVNFFVDSPSSPRLSDAARSEVARFYAEAGLGEVPEAAEPKPLWSGALADVLCDLKPAAVSFHFGLPPAGDLARLKAAGIPILSSATTVREAVALEAAGVDAVIAQGWEAGGHRGSHVPGGLGDGVGLIALVPQVADAVRVPVIAAGGIGDGRGIRAALALGAAGVQMGTAFLLCPECGTEPGHRGAVEGASDDDTVLTDAFSGRPARARRSAYADAMRRFAGEMAPFRAMYAVSGPLEEASGADGAATFHLYGQSAALARAEPAGDLVRRLAREALG